MSLGPLYVLLGEVSVQVFAHFLNWVFCFPGVMELESIMLSEINQVMRDKYHIISPLTGTKSTKEKNKQNITRDIEIKNNLTIARGEG